MRLDADPRTGELLLSGSQLDEASGYYGDEALTGEKFFRHPATGEMCYRTGDVAAVAGDGAGSRLSVDGRLDRQVKLNGVRIELGETPAKLREFLPEVLKACWCAVDSGSR